MKIAIIGAGIGGLTLATAIKKTSPETLIEIYEQDASPTSRTQGYAIGLKGDGGLHVLDELGLRTKVLTSNALKVTNFVFTNQFGHELLALPSSDEKHLTYRIQRQHLKEVLLKASSGAPIHFGKNCTGYTQTASQASVLFSDGTSTTADYIVGCDGVASAVRQQMLGDQKQYLGLTAIVGEAKIALEDPLLDGGYFMTLGNNGSSVFAYTQPGGVHFSYTMPTASEADLAALPKSDLLKQVQQGVQGWHGLIQQIVGAAQVESLLVRGYYDKKPARTIRDGRVWLLGDAAHPMCPFQGQGANMAMIDALKLAEWFAKPTQDTAVELEADIIQRGRKAVLESRSAAKQFHTTSKLKQFNRNVGFKIANAIIKRFSKKRV